MLIGSDPASLIMVLFLRDWGTSLVAGLVIPATLAVTFIALRALGESFNLMTLGGLAAAVGLVIDDAIVVVENIVMHRDAGQDRSEAIRSAIAEIRVPLIGSTITPIVVFLPLISITGVTGTFFRALAVTVGMALLTSLALALTWTPTLSHSSSAANRVAMHPAPSTQHPAPSTQHPAPSTQHPAPSTQHPALSTQHPAPSTQHPAPSTQHPALSTQHAAAAPTECRRESWPRTNGRFGRRSRDRPRSSWER